MRVTTSGEKVNRFVDEGEPASLHQCNVGRDGNPLTLTQTICWQRERSGRCTSVGSFRLGLQ